MNKLFLTMALALITTIASAQLSVLPYDGGTYTQAPFEDITKKEFDKLVKHLQDVNLQNVVEETDETDLSGELACAGGSCEITGL